MVDTPRATLALETIHGLPRGVVRGKPIHELGIGEAWTILDMLVDKPGIIRARGGFAVLGSNGGVGSSFNTTVFAFLSRVPAGSSSTPYLFGFHGSNKHLYYFNNTASPIDLGVICANSPSAAAPGLRGMVLVSGGPFGTGQAFLSRGGRSATYSTGTITVTRGSTAVAGAGSTWTSAMAGGFLCSLNLDKVYGVVSSVTSGTALVLEEPSLYAAAGATYAIVPVRSPYPRIGKGRITCTTGSAVVTGALTKFNEVTRLGGTWDMYRLSDLTFIGTVTSVQSDRQVTLTANAAIALASERFIMVKSGTANMYDPTSGNTDNQIGCLAATYAKLQFWANRGLNFPVGSFQGTQQDRLFFSDARDMEMIDTSPSDGDFLVVSSQTKPGLPITAIYGMQQGLAIFKETELWFLTGDDPTNFVLTKIADVGVNGMQSVVSWRGSIAFIDREGIFLFDGVRLTNLTAPLGEEWRLRFAQRGNAANAVNIYRDHVIAVLGPPQSNANSGISVVKGAATTREVQSLTMVINLQTGAITFFGNMRPVALVELPSDFIDAPAASASDTVFAQTCAEDNLMRIYSMQAVWEGSAAADAFTFIAAGATCLGKGPNPYIELGRHDMDMPERSKYFKDVILQYVTSGGTVTVDSVDGIDPAGAGVTQADTLPNGAGVYARNRVRLQRRGTHMGLRIYPTAAQALTSWIIGVYSIRFRAQRMTRIR